MKNFPLWILICCFLSGALLNFAPQHPDLEQMIINTDLEGVKAALRESNITQLEKNGLVSLADDMTLKRMKHYEWYEIEKPAPLSLDVGLLVAVLSFPLLPVCPFLGLYNERSSTQEIILVGAGATTITAAVFAGGCMLIRAARKTIRCEYEAVKNAHINAAKIKQLILMTPVGY